MFRGAQFLGCCGSEQFLEVPADLLRSCLPNPSGGHSIPLAYGVCLDYHGFL
jgi:hypothetical protein